MAASRHIFSPSRSNGALPHPSTLYDAPACSSSGWSQAVYVKEGAENFLPKKTLKGSEGLAMMSQLADILGPIQASLPDPLPASEIRCDTVWVPMRDRSEEHTAELQSRQYLVCRLLLGKKKNRQKCMGAEPPRPGGVDHTRHERPSSLTQHRPPSR